MTLACTVHRRAAQLQCTRVMQSSSNGNAQARLRACFVPVCESASETLAHIQCRCSALTEVRIRAHHTLAAMLWGCLTNLSKEWQIHREVLVAAMGNIKAVVAVGLCCLLLAHYLL